MQSSGEHASMTSTLTFLGTGTSVGVPVIGCPCAICASPHPYNQRTRSSIHLRTPELSLLVDFGPDLRQQALREQLTVVDVVLVTHAHLDHIAGFDELRAFCWHRNAPLPMFAGPATMASLREMFPWAFLAHQNQGYVQPDPHVVKGPFEFGDLRITPLPVEHAGIETLGFRFDLPGNQSLAYISDVKSIPATTLPLLADLDLLAIDALRPGRHDTHMSLDEALAAIATISPRETLLTHLSHELDATTLELPESVALAHDGLKLHFQPGPSRAINHEPNPLP